MGRRRIHAAFISYYTLGYPELVYSYCKPLGRPPKEPPSDEMKSRMAKAIGEHNEIECSFGTGKRIYRANDIRAKLPDTARCWTGMCYFVKKRDEVPEGTLSCPDRNLAVFRHYRPYEGLRLLPSVCEQIIIQQTLISVICCPLYTNYIANHCSTNCHRCTVVYIFVYTSYILIYNTQSQFQWKTVSVTN